MLLRTSFIRTRNKSGFGVGLPPSLKHRQFSVREKSTFNILSLDGGGVRGSFTAAVLARLEAECGPKFMDSFDLIAGTSTGAVIALCLAKGMKISEAGEQYRTACPEIFATRAPYNPFQQFSGNLFKAKYENATLKKHLRGWLGDTKLGELSKNVVLTAFNVHGVASSTHISQEHNRLHHAHADGSVQQAARWRPAVFSNLPPVEGVVGSDHNLLCVDAALRSTAAPTFFPVYQGYCDGAMTANNPSLVAISKALAHFPRDLHRENVRVLSLGAGSRLKALSATTSQHPTHESSSFGNLGGGGAGAGSGAGMVGGDGGMDWGLVNWAPHLISLLMDSSALSTDLLVGLMIGHRHQYHRLECALVPPSGYTLAIDEARAIPLLVDLANRVDLSETVKFLKEEIMAEELEGEEARLQHERPHRQQQQQQQPLRTQDPGLSTSRRSGSVSINQIASERSSEKNADAVSAESAAASLTASATPPAVHGAEPDHLLADLAADHESLVGFGGSSLKMRYYEQLAEVDDAWEKVALATIQTDLPKEHRLSEKRR